MAQAERQDSDGSSSLSDSDPPGADEDELQTALSDDDALLDAQWFMQGASTHFVQETAEAGFNPVPWCRTKPYPDPPKETGEGVVTVSPGTLCGRCLGRMPRSLYKAITGFCAERAS